MVRRWLAILTVWLGVFGIASPTLVCATAAAPARDCCPDGAPAPCGGGTPSELACCIAVPASTPASTISANTEQHVVDHAGGAPDPLILSAWLSAFAQAGRPAEPLEFLPSVTRSDATLTYLHTRRLRL